MSYVRMSPELQALSPREDSGQMTSLPERHVGKFCGPRWGRAGDRLEGDVKAFGGYIAYLCG